MLVNAEPAQHVDPVVAIDESLDGFTRWHGDGMATSWLRLAGLHCAACSSLVTHALQSVAGVRSAQVNAAAAVAQVRWEPATTSLPALLAAVRRAGYDAAPDRPADARALRRREQRQVLWRLFVAAFCAMQVMMLATPVYLAEPTDMPADLRQLMHWGSWLLTLPVLAFSAWPYFTGAWAAMRQGRMAMDLPIALGLAVSFVASTGAAFDPAGVFGSEVYFDSLTMFVAFLLGARWLAVRAQHRAAETLDDCVTQLPETAQRVCADGGLEAVPAHLLRSGDRVRTVLGAAFAADGMLCEGCTAVDESLLTGESRPITKRCGDTLWAGSLNLGAPVDMKVLRAAAATRRAGIVELARNAQTQRPALSTSIDRWAGPFLLGVLLLAAGAAALWSLVEPARALWVAVSVLIVTCPCALSLAAPSAQLAASGRLARHGVLLRRADALEAMAAVQTLYIDKTGTLTEAQPHWRGLQRLVPRDEACARDDASLLNHAASLAAWSNHPLARALAAQGRPGLAPPWCDVREVVGAGVLARDDKGCEWRLGSAAFLGLDAATDDDTLQLWFGPPGQAVLRLHFDETVRADAALAVQRLRQLGIELRLLSGDLPQRVQRLAASLGIASAQHSATPQAKLEAVRAEQAAGRVVAMLGDGLNDAPVLAQANVSLAMGEGADIARRSADVVLLSMRLADVAEAFAMARRCRQVTRQNMLWAVVYNASCIPLALAGWLPPWLAGLGMAGSSLFVIGNALRLAR